MHKGIVKHIEKSIKDNWQIPALSNYNGTAFTYADIALKIRCLHNIFRENHIKNGDKIALIGKNSANWAITYLATITYGSVIVPILPEFHPTEMHHILNHSDSVFLFIADDIYEKIDTTGLQNLQAIFSLSDFRLIYHSDKSITTRVEKAIQLELEKYDNNFIPANFSLNEIKTDEIAAIVYTSGTTGLSKGVMLSHNSLTANVRFAQENMPLQAGDKILSFLPLAHSFGCAFEFLFPFTLGCHITFLDRIPSPKVIEKAFQQIRPKLILSVPLVIEKIYKKHIITHIDKKKARVLLKIPVLSKLFHRKLNKRLKAFFGNNFYEIIIGGADLDKEVEAFFRKIKFPLTVGYGLTECGPLVSYASWEKNKNFSAGNVVDTLEIKIDSEDPQNIVGEILVRGKNVMNGYYKNIEKTEKAIGENGWLYTGDLGLIDEEGYIYIKGRSKNMILTSSGQNIYPEEIETKLNNLPYVEESLIIEKNKKLIAIVHPDFEMMNTKGLDKRRLEDLMEENRRSLNKKLPTYSPVSKIEIHPEEFEKTPTKKIKRHQYTG